MNPLVSIIIPNYNHAKYLDERIHSILNQTYLNTEIIILDDSSQDNSIEIIDKYRSIPQISHIVINKINSGSTFKQWYKGLLLAKGDLIWIAESDDSCDPNLLKSLIDEIENNPGCVIAYSLSRFIDENSNQYGKYIKPFKNQILNGKYYIQHYMSTGNHIRNASSAIFNKKAALSLDKTYMNYKGGGDRLFWIEMAEKGKVAIVNKQLNYFRRHAGVITSKYYLNGTNYREDKKTFDYMCNRNILSPIHKILSKGFYWYQLYNSTFDSNKTKQELLKIWHAPSFKYTPIIYLGKAYHYIKDHYQLYL